MNDVEQVRQSAEEQLLSELNGTFRPFQTEINNLKKKADLLNQIIRLTKRDAFLQLEEILTGNQIRSILDEKKLEVSRPTLEKLRSLTSAKVEQYRLRFVNDLTDLALKNQLPLTIQFPDFQCLVGIEGKIDFANRVTYINKKKLKSVDPTRIIAALIKAKKELYREKFEPRRFIDDLYTTYIQIVKSSFISEGESVPIQVFYREYVMSLQSKTFFQDMDKSRFNGYAMDQFAVDFYRFFKSEVAHTSNHRVLKLSPGRGQSLWLFDEEGKRRHITGLSFVRSQE